MLAPFQSSPSRVAIPEVANAPLKMIRISRGGRPGSIEGGTAADAKTMYVC
jgi:hypothetical protein